MKSFVFSSTAMAVQNCYIAPFKILRETNPNVKTDDLLFSNNGRL